MGRSTTHHAAYGPRTALLLGLLLALAAPAWQAPAEATTACRNGYVALTFDDGPSPTTTPPVLDVLARRQVPATFFVVGVRVDGRRDLVARMAREGHAVANHTYYHERLTDLGDTAIRRTVDRTHRAIRDAGARPLRLVRPPYGLTSARVRAALRDGGYAHVMWSVDPRDWESSTSHIRSFVLGSLRDGAVILLHDGVRNAPATIRALPDIIDGTRARGYCFTTLDEAGRLERPTVLSIDWRDHGGPYRDVPPTSTHAPAITRLKDLGVTKGCGDGDYCPDEHLTRGQMASFLQRALGLPGGPTDGFRDVGPDSPHAAAIGALHQAGITRGCTDDGRSYCPNERIRRDQMASLLQRALALPDGREDRFRDVVPGSTHAAAVGAVHEAGITRGCTDDGRSFCPGGRVTRAQAASFVSRALDHLAR